MDWVNVLSQSELPEGERRVVRVTERDVMLVNHQGHIYAVDNVCPHLGASLAKGVVTEDGAIICPRHHSAFDLRTGDVKEWSPWPPAVGRMLGVVSREKALRVYPTRLEENSIWVGLEGS